MLKLRQSLRGRLRSETRELHDALESLVAIDRQIASPADYAAYLLRLWACHTVAEAALLEFDFAPLGFDYRTCIRSRLIEADLEHLGITSARRAAQPLPDRPQLPTIEAALGYVYVIEGSAIGARAILPEITTALGFDAQRGASFFGGLREGKQVWQGCLTALDAIDCDSRPADAVVQSSKEAFRLFLRWLPSTEQTTLSSVQLS